jgi:hypothetical protein
MRIEIKDVQNFRDSFIEIHIDGNFADCFAYDQNKSWTKFFAYRRCIEALRRKDYKKTTKTIRDYVI